MCIYLLFDFRKLRNFRCFPFPENSGTPTFPISRNSGLRRFLLLVINSCISPFTCDSVVSPCFMYYSRLCTQVFSLYPVHTCPTPFYKHLYSVARIPELRLLLCPPSRSSFLSPLRDLKDLSPTRLLIIPTRYLFPDPEIPESGNSHALSHSEIWDPWGIPQGTGQYPESALVIRIRYFILLLITSFSYSLDPFGIQFVTLSALLCTLRIHTFFVYCAHWSHVPTVTHPPPLAWLRSPSLHITGCFPWRYFPYFLAIYIL